ncbi:MAG TPA: hypothetical protein VI387_08015, partial [Candidatus Brocadiales bacterium]|nr:hypothetical protein [Candidatus Brocadiales bacterium]
MSEMQACEPIEIHLAGGDVVTSTRTGVTFINTEVQSIKYRIRIEDVLYLPKLDVNLISGWELDRSGYHTAIFQGKMTVSFTEKSQMVAYMHARPYLSYTNLYYVEEARKEDKLLLVQGKNPDDPTIPSKRQESRLELECWHQRAQEATSNEESKSANARAQEVQQMQIEQEVAQAKDLGIRRSQRIKEPSREALESIASSSTKRHQMRHMSKEARKSRTW